MGSASHFVLALIGSAALAGCQGPGPARDAAQALAQGDQRALALITVDPEGGLAWATTGLSCDDLRPIPLRKVGRTLADHERFQAYVRTYNAALSSHRRYRYRAHCGPRSRLPNGVEHGVR